MNSEVMITLTGDNIPTFYPIGASVTYGINRVPSATVQLGPVSLPLLCDFDAIRRHPATLVIKTDGGCLEFDGIIDGFSISQQPGGLVTSLVLKHPFTYLNEVYPRILGLNAGGTNVFAINAPCQVNPSGLATLEGPSNANLLEDFQQLYGYTTNGQLDMNTNVIDFIVNLAKVIVRSQTFGAGTFPTDTFTSRQTALTSALQAADINKKVLAPTVLALLNQIDTSYCSGMVLAANAANIADRIIKDIGFLQDTLLTSMIRLFAEYGCCLIIGNGTAFVLPEATYLLVPKTQNLYRGVHGADFNVIMPSEYENFSFNDNGENTIKGVYVIDDPQTSMNTLGNSSTGALSGVYIDPSPFVFGNIVVRTLPDFATTASSFACGVGSLGIHRNVFNQAPLVSGKVATDEAYAALQQVQTTIDNNATAPAQAFLNDWAQLEYCKIKYEDRTGSINTYFGNIFAPGAVGSIYTRQPGMYIDFFVTSVSHSFSLGAPSSGSASTNVTFKGGRMGNSAANGLDVLSLYDSGYSDSSAFCSSFVKDISGA